MKLLYRLIQLISYIFFLLHFELIQVNAQTSYPEVIELPTSSKREISMQEAIEIALANNSNVELSRKNIRSVQFDLQQAQSSYETRFLISSHFDRQRLPGTNIFNSSPNNISILNRNQTNSLGLEKSLQFWGTKVKSEFTLTHNSTNDSFSVFRTSVESALTFTLTQPLARGRSFDNIRQQIEITKHNLTLSDQKFRQSLVDTITNVQRAYWDLVFALKNLEVQQNVVATTKAQLLHTKRLIDEGRLAAVDLITVQSQLTKFIAEQNSAVATVLRAESELKKSINADETVWQQTLLPIDNINLLTPTIKLSEALKVAMNNRLELYQQKSVKAINDINQQFFREQTKPDIDLTLSYSMNGFAGKPATNNNSTEIFSSTIEQPRLFTVRTKPSMIAQTTLPPPLLIGSYGQSLNNLFQNRFSSFRIGITISFPIRNSFAKAELGKSLVDAEKIAIETRQLVQNIQAEVRNALQDLQVAEAKLKAAESIRLAASQLLESEKRKFEVGHENASINLILEKQRELSLAQSQELGARIDLNRSINELQRAMGVTLEQHKVVMKY